MHQGAAYNMACDSVSSKALDVRTNERHKFLALLRGSMHEDVLDDKVSEYTPAELRRTCREPKNIENK